MNKTLLAAASALLFTGAVVLPVGVAIAPTAAEAKASISAKVGKPLHEADALAKAKNFSGALAKAKEADAVPGKTPYEEFVVKDFLTSGDVVWHAGFLFGLDGVPAIGVEEGILECHQQFGVLRGGEARQVADIGGFCHPQRLHTEGPQVFADAAEGVGDGDRHP